MNSHQSPLASPNLVESLQQFLNAVDRGVSEEVFAFYHADFCCVRTANGGAVANLDRAAMIGFWHSLACRPEGAAAAGTRASQTEVLLVASHDAWGVALLLREKNFGPGAEKVFYELVWKLGDSGWLLWREFVQQKHVPAWAGGGAR